jgi:hypothetical protein
MKIISIAIGYLMLLTADITSPWTISEIILNAVWIISATVLITIPVIFAHKENMKNG